MWSRLVRFEDDDQHVQYGEPDISADDDILQLLNDRKLYAHSYKGKSMFSLSPSPGPRLRVKTLLGLLEQSDVPLLRCIAINYKAPIAARGMKAPANPVSFIKSPATIASWGEDIPIPKLAQDEQLDYEGELSIVIGKSGKNIPKEKALEHIAGYLASNDVTARKWERHEFAGPCPQFGYAKGFDKFSPVGMMLVSPQILGAADNLRLQTFVNGEARQDSSTSDLLFPVEELISFLSQGTTLERGTVIMTGSPGGMAMAMKPPKWLKHGDVVEVKIEGLGCVRNKMVWE